MRQALLTYRILPLTILLQRPKTAAETELLTWIPSSGSASAAQAYNNWLLVPDPTAGMWPGSGLRVHVERLDKDVGSELLECCGGFCTYPVPEAVSLTGPRGDSSAARPAWGSW